MTDENIARLMIAGIGVVGTLLGTLLGGLITWRITRSTQELQKQLAQASVKASERAGIDGQLVKMLDLLIHHPQLESDAVCQAYPNIGNPNLKNGDVTKERYKIFCIFVFNFLQTAFIHFDRDPEQLAEYIGLEEIVGCHHKWWYHDKQNLVYDPAFRRCIQTIYDQMRKDGKIP